MISGSTPPPLKGPLGIFGVGMMGGSIGARAKALGFHVLGYDDPGVLSEALACEVIDEAVGLAELYARSETVILAAHLESTLSELARLVEHPESGPALIMDIGSVKGVVAEISAGLANFIPGHPMAGTERSGPSAAVPALFEGRTWVYVPSGRAELDARAAAFIAAMGARPVAVDAREHDRVVAQTSHLPQMHATLYAQRLHRRDHQELVEDLCGPTGRELLRLSRSAYPMWRDIFIHNRANVEAELRAQARALEAAADALRDGELRLVEQAFYECRQSTGLANGGCTSPDLGELHGGGVTDLSGKGPSPSRLQRRIP